MDWNRLVEEASAALVLYARQRVTSHAEAEEAVQEGFVRTWQAVGQGRVPEDRVIPYLYRAVNSAAIDLMRRQFRRQRREDKVYREQEATEPFFLPSEPGDTRAGEVEEALKALPSEQRDVLTMKIWGDMTFDAIGEALGISINTAASRYRYGIEALRKRLKQESA